MLLLIVMVAFSGSGAAGFGAAGLGEFAGFHMVAILPFSCAFECGAAASFRRLPVDHLQIWDYRQGLGTFVAKLRAVRGTPELLNWPCFARASQTARTARTNGCGVIIYTPLAFLISGNTLR
jgi:hypothetical protein